MYIITGNYQLRVLVVLCSLNSGFVVNLQAVVKVFCLENARHALVCCIATTLLLC